MCFIYNADVCFSDNMECVLLIMLMCVSQTMWSVWTLVGSRGRRRFGSGCTSLRSLRCPSPNGSSRSRDSGTCLGLSERGLESCDSGTCLGLSERGLESCDSGTCLGLSERGLESCDSGTCLGLSERGLESCDSGTCLGLSERGLESCDSGTCLGLSERGLESCDSGTCLGLSERGLESCDSGTCLGLSERGLESCDSGTCLGLSERGLESCDFLNGGGGEYRALFLSLIRMILLYLFEHCIDLAEALQSAPVYSKRLLRIQTKMRPWQPGRETRTLRCFRSLP